MIFVGAILGAITGTVAASVIAIGMISIPIMMKYGYDMRIGTGVIAASGTITQVIPPSLVLIVLAFQLGVPVGDMYLGAIGPSIAQVLLFAGFILLVSIFRPHKVPALPPEARTLKGSQLAAKLAWGMVPSLVLIFLVLGTIFMGLATPTEAGAMGSVGSVLLALAHGRYSNQDAVGGLGPDHADHRDGDLHPGRRDRLQPGLPGRERREVDRAPSVAHPGWTDRFPDLRHIFIFFIAFFLDFFEIVFIVIPLLIPTALALDIDLVWLGVLLCVNMQTAFMHPPFGFALFYLRGIAPPEIKSRDIYLGSIPWIILQLILVALIITFPGIVDGFITEAVLLDDAAVEQQLDALPMPGLEPPALDLDLGPAPAPAGD